MIAGLFFKDGNVQVMVAELKHITVLLNFVHDTELEAERGTFWEERKGSFFFFSAQQRPFVTYHSLHIKS